MDLGLTTEKIKLISANRIRATVMTESLKACYKFVYFIVVIYYMLILLLLLIVV